MWSHDEKLFLASLPRMRVKMSTQTGIKKNIMLLFEELRGELNT